MEKNFFIWSAGKNAKEAKAEIIEGSCLVACWIALFISGFFVEVHDMDRYSKIIFFNIFMPILTSFILFLGVASIKIAKEKKERNTVFELKIISMDIFLKEPSKVKKEEIVFSDKDGFVICADKDKIAYLDWIGNKKINTYFDFLNALEYNDI